MHSVNGSVTAIWVERSEPGATCWPLLPTRGGVLGLGFASLPNEGGTCKACSTCQAAGIYVSLLFKVGNGGQRFGFVNLPVPFRQVVGCGERMGAQSRC